MQLIQKIKTNAHMHFYWIAGVIVGLTILKFTGLRFGKEFRHTKCYSTIAANIAADGNIVWFPK